MESDNPKFGDQLYCPDCKPILSKSRRRLTGLLSVVERNYSGCGVDYMHCPDCGHVFCVSYRVDEMVRATDWENKEEIENLAEERLERSSQRMLKWVLKNVPDKITDANILKQLEDIKAHLEKLES